MNAGDAHTLHNPDNGPTGTSRSESARTRAGSCSSRASVQARASNRAMRAHQANASADHPARRTPARFASMDANIMPDP